MTAPTPHCEKTEESAWPDGRWISLRENTPAAVLYALGLTTMYVGFWLDGRVGLGFSEPPPDYGGEWWLIVALLGLASLCGFSYAHRRLRSRGFDTTQMWGVVRPLHDAEARSYERRQVTRSAVVFGLQGGLIALLVLAIAFVFNFDQWIDPGYGRVLTIAGASIFGAFGALRIRRRIAAQYAYGHVPYDWVAYAVSLMSALLTLATIWIAGRTGVPTTSGGGLSKGVSLIVLAGGLILFLTSVLRLRIRSRPEAAETSVGAPS